MTYRMMKNSFTNQDGEAEDNEIITGIDKKMIDKMINRKRK